MSGSSTITSPSPSGSARPATPRNGSNRRLLGRLWVAAAMVASGAALTTIDAVPATAGPPVVSVGPGDGVVALSFNSTSNVMVTNGYTINTSGGAVTAGGTTADGRYWVTFDGLTGGSFTNAQITNWRYTEVTTAIDPVCTISAITQSATASTIEFQCSPFPGTTLSGHSLFISYTDFRRPDRSGTVPGTFYLTSSDATADHVPTNQYRSAGTGAATVSKTATGQYSVRIPNAAYAYGQGTAYTTAKTVSAAVDPSYVRYCNPQSWYPLGPDMVVKVGCFNGGGAWANATFTLALTKSNYFGRTSNPSGALWASDTTSAEHDITSYSWSSTSSTNTVRSLAPWYGAGISEAKFPHAYDPTRRASAMVSAYGTLRCSLWTLGENPALGYDFADVRCFYPLGGNATSSYSISLVEI